MKKMLFISSLLILVNSSFAYDGLGNQFTSKTNSTAKAFTQSKILSVSPTSTTSVPTNYTLQSVVENDITIQEYVDGNNNIFAVTWSGVTTPDFASLLGNYANFKDNNPSVKDLKHKLITDNNLVISKNYSGRLKRGYAYLTNLIPTGFDLSTLSQ